MTLVNLPAHYIEPIHLSGAANRRITRNPPKLHPSVIFSPACRVSRDHHWAERLMANPRGTRTLLRCETSGRSSTTRYSAVRCWPRSTPAGSAPWTSATPLLTCSGLPSSMVSPASPRARCAARRRSRWSRGCTATSSSTSRVLPAHLRNSSGWPTFSASSPSMLWKFAGRAAGTTWCSRTSSVLEQRTHAHGGPQVSDGRHGIDGNRIPPRTEGRSAERRTPTRRSGRVLSERPGKSSLAGGGTRPR